MLPVTRPERSEPEITVAVPDTLPVLTPSAARALLRLLLHASNDHRAATPTTDEEQAA